MPYSILPPYHESTTAELRAGPTELEFEKFWNKEKIWLFFASIQAATAFLLRNHGRCRAELNSENSKLDWRSGWHLTQIDRFK